MRRQLIDLGGSTRRTRKAHESDHVQSINQSITPTSLKHNAPSKLSQSKTKERKKELKTVRENGLDLWLRTEEELVGLVLLAHQAFSRLGAVVELLLTRPALRANDDDDAALRLHAL